MVGEQRQGVPDVGARHADHRLVHAQLGGSGACVLDAQADVRRPADDGACGHDPGGAHAQVQWPQGGVSGMVPGSASAAAPVGLQDGADGAGRARSRAAGVRKRLAVRTCLAVNARGGMGWKSCVLVPRVSAA